MKEEIKENEVKETELKVISSSEKVFNLVREKFVYNGKEMYNYMVKGNALGRDIKANFIPKDKGGYEVLNIDFTLGNVELVIKDKKMTDNSGHRTTITSYIARVIVGETVYSCDMKPANSSDKAFLEMLLNERK